MRVRFGIFVKKKFALAHSLSLSLFRFRRFAKFQADSQAGTHTRIHGVVNKLLNSRR